MSDVPSMPRGACDCHVHIYEDGYPLAPSASFQPSHSPVSAYREVQQALGLERAVLVQPTGYGFDNRCLLDALAQFAAAGVPTCGIAVVPADISDLELQGLHDAGVRGVRFMMLARSGGLLPWEALPTMAARIAPLGWNINLQLDGRELPQRREVIDRLPGKVVIDHTGKFLEPVPPHDPAFKALLRLLEREGRWVKLSAPYETSRCEAPHYDDVTALALALVATHPERCLWASNWPHPNFRPRPADADMLKLLESWAPDPHVRESILVHNPASLYGFGAGIA